MEKKEEGEPQTEKEEEKKEEKAKEKEDGGKRSRRKGKKRQKEKRKKPERRSPLTGLYINRKTSVLPAAPAGFWIARASRPMSRRHAEAPSTRSFGDRPQAPGPRLGCRRPAHAAALIQAHLMPAVHAHPAVDPASTRVPALANPLRVRDNLRTLARGEHCAWSAPEASGARPAFPRAPGLPGRRAFICPHRAK